MVAVRPIVSDDLIDEIADLLHIDDQAKRTHLAARLQRYADDYFHGLVRWENTPDEGEARQDAQDLPGQIDQLEKTIRGLQMAPAFQRGYRIARRQGGGRYGPTLASLQLQLNALRGVAQYVSQAPPATRGPKGRAVLRQVIGSLMALFEHFTKSRAGTTTSREGIKGTYLRGPEALAIGLYFKGIDPALRQVTLVNLVDKINAEFHQRPMSEGHFNFISKLEDEGGFEVSSVRD